MLFQWSHHLNDVHNVFLKGKSTVTNPLSFKFSKTFDLLNHLLYKLEIWIFVSLNIAINSYLTNKFQYVERFGCCSLVFHVTSKVPQCSVHRPVLFNILTNGTFSKASAECFLYADDLKPPKLITNNDDYIELQSYLDLVSKWCTDNQLHLNES